MGLFEKKFCISGWNGESHFLTAKKLYERILEDSKSDYGWIASATELVRVCNQESFPKEYAQKIKIIILNCFANLETQKEYPSHSLSTDKAAVYSCYHSLIGRNDDIVVVKRKYLAAIIQATIKYDHYACRIPIHVGPSYRKVCEEWKKAKVEEYASKEEIDFEKMRKDLYADFDKTIHDAEKSGVFKDDDEKFQEEMRTFWSSIDLENLYI